MTDPDIIKRSVTREDYSPTPQAPVLIYAWGWPYQRKQADLPPWWSHERDRMLRATVTQDPLWAGAVFKATTKIAALGWNLSDTTQAAETKKKRAQDLLLQADAGTGWVPFVTKVLRDFLTTDNGAFVEVVRASSAAGSRILGLVHLDSDRCTRTGHPGYPVLYRDHQGNEHYLRDYQVLSFVDMADPAEHYHGVGLCAASRCYETIVRQAAMNLYLREKMTGDGATELAFVQGLGPGQMESALLTGDEAAKRKSVVHYKGKLVVPVMSDTPLSIATIPLKNVPDGFDPTQLREQAAQDYANNLGIPVQDIIPLSGQGLGTGQQTLILAEDADGQGLAAFRRQWTHALNTRVLPTSTTFAWTNANDTRDKKAQADAQQAQATVLKTLVEAKVITTAIALQIATDWDLVPREFLPEDLTPGGGVLSDDEQAQQNPGPQQLLAVAQQLQQLQFGMPKPAPEGQAQKALSADDAALFADEFEQAVALARLAQEAA